MHRQWCAAGSRLPSCGPAWGRPVRLAVAFLAGMAFAVAAAAFEAAVAAWRALAGKTATLAFAAGMAAGRAETALAAAFAGRRFAASVL